MSSNRSSNREAIQGGSDVDYGISDVEDAITPVKTNDDVSVGKRRKENSTPSIRIRSATNYYRTFNSDGSSSCNVCGKSWPARTSTSNILRHVRNVHSICPVGIPPKKDDVPVRKPRKERPISSFKSAGYNHRTFNLDGSSNCKVCGKLWPAGTKTGNILRHVRLVHSTCSVGTLPGAQRSRRTGQPRPLLHQVDQTEMNQALVDVILAAKLSFSIVDLPEFRALMDKASRGVYRLPGKRLISQQVSFQFEEWKEKVRSALKNAGSRIALSLDHCEEGVRYLVIIAKWIDNELEALQSCILDYKETSESQTAEDIRRDVLATLSDFDIADKVFAITADNATNFTSDVELLKVDYPELLRVSCGTHVINSVCKEALDQIEEMVTKIRGIAVYLHFSPETKKLCLEKLKQFDLNIGSPERKARKIFLDVKTRWDSVYSMLATAYDYKDVLDELCLEVETLTRFSVSHSEWVEICDYIRLLKPCYIETQNIRKDHVPTLSRILPCLLELKNHLERNSGDAHPEIAKAVACMSAKLQTYLDGMNVPEIHAAVFLDPRYKMDFLDEEEKDSVLIYIENLLDRRVNRKHQLYEASCSEPTGLLERFRQRPRPAMNISGQLKKYCESIAVADKVNVIQWWRDHRREFPDLAELAFDYMAIDVTSVGSGRANFQCYQYDTNFRTKLKPEEIRARICLRAWKRDLSKDGKFECREAEDERDDDSDFEAKEITEKIDLEREVDMEEQPDDYDGSSGLPL